MAGLLSGRRAKRPSCPESRFGRFFRCEKTSPSLRFQPRRKLLRRSIVKMKHFADGRTPFWQAGETPVLSRKPVRSVFSMRKNIALTSIPAATQTVASLHRQNEAFCRWQDSFLAGGRNARPVPKAGSVGFFDAKKHRPHFDSSRDANCCVAP